MCSYNMQCVAGQPPDLSVLVAIYWCLSKRTQLVSSGVECGGVRDVAEQQHCLQNY